MVKDILPVLIARIFPRSILHKLSVKPLNKVEVFFNLVPCLYNLTTLQKF